MSEYMRVTIQGQVQGVGFRYATWSKARGLGLTGWVRNLRDGRVEAEFEGDQARLEQMLDWCRRGPLGAQVREVEAAWREGPAKYADFEIRY